MAQHRVVIVGGGFGGLHAARKLRRAPVDVTLIDRRNFHLFQPLLYQVATGGLSPANISAPIRSILRSQRNCAVRLGNVVDIDAAQSRVVMEDGTIEFDSLIVAAGARHSYFGNEHWRRFAPGLKTVEDATDIRRMVLTAFEEAERETDAAQRQACLTFVVIGGGPTGVEMAGAIAELRRDTLKHDFRNIDSAEARVILVDMQDRVLGTFDQKLSAKAEHSLNKLCVELRLNARVIELADGLLTLESGGDETTIHAHSMIWAAGVRAGALAAKVAAATHCEQDRAGRLVVNADCSLGPHDNIFAIGDIASYLHQNAKPLPGVAPVAIQQGRFVADLILRRLAGKPPAEFRYRDRGNLATIGRRAAVAEIGKMKFSGYPAWLVWLAVHLMQIVQHQNRVLILVQWAWNYLTFNRSARLITERKAAADADSLEIV